MNINSTIAVLLTVHNRKEKTLNCLGHLYSNNRNKCNVKVFLTDDGCTDGTAEAVRMKYPDVNIIVGDGTLFWNRGMLVAWKEASKINPDYYLWLNDDTMLFEDALRKLVDCAIAKDNQSIIVGSTKDSTGNLSYGGHTKKRPYPCIMPIADKEVECDTFNGNIVLIPNCVCKILGCNDPYFHHSFGDFEYGLRATNNGIACLIGPGFYGICERNNPIPIFRRKQYSLIKRYKLLYSPLGFNPCEDFYLNKKYYPLWKCCLWFIKLHINVLFPKDHTKY